MVKRTNAVVAALAVNAAQSGAGSTSFATALRDQGVLPAGSLRQLNAQIPPGEIAWPSAAQ
jgi:hypothetical protein